MNESKTLNTRQWDLYNFLKSQYESGNFISKKVICENLPQHYKFDTKQTRMCRRIEEDIREINECQLIQKIIVSNHKGYKIGSKEESKDYIEKRFIRDLKNLKLNWLLSKKTNLDGQIKIAFGKYERECIEAFMKEEKE